nr:hypothetical protein [Burkholderia anthina]
MKWHLVVDVVNADAIPFLTAHTHGPSGGVLRTKAIVRINLFDEIGNLIRIVAVKTMRLDR